MKSKFDIEGMSCAACSAAVEKAVTKLEGVVEAPVNLLAKSMLCEYDESKVSVDDIINAVDRAGFSAELHPEATVSDVMAAEPAPKKEERFTPVKTRLIVSIIFLLALMYVSMGHMLGAPLPHVLHGVQNGVAFAFLQFLLTLPVVYVNRKFYYSGFAALMRRAPNMDTLVAVGSGAALVYGAAAIFMIGYGLGNGRADIAQKYVSNLYFESASMILTLVTLGKFLEERSKGKTNSAVMKLMDLSPKTATVLRGGKEVTVKAEEIIAGDLVIIRPGETVPVDGVITDGSSQLDQSALTGESMPVEKAKGDSVMSASSNLNGSFTMRATKVGSDTTLAQIIRLVENAGATKAPVARLADKIAGVFVPVVIAVAIVTLAAWLIAGKGLEFALSNAICVLVISCPCALGLATPVAITVSTGRCAGSGILIKSAQALENLCRVDTVVFDKTGTLTTGKPTVTNIIPFGVEKNELLRVAAALEDGSEHPLARAICEFAGKSDVKSTNFTSVTGKGVTAVINEKTATGGSAAFTAESGVDVATASPIVESLAAQGKTPMLFTLNSVLIGVIAVADEVRENAVLAVKELTNGGKQAILLTGDNERTAQAIGKRLGVSRVIAEVLPAQKAEKIKELQQGSGLVAMVGDGINDSPALTQADVGIAMSVGTDIAIDSADIVLMNNNPHDVVKAITFSRKTLRNIKQNLFWAFFYNVIGIPVAAGLLWPLWGITLSPMLGAAAMSLSSVFVVTNALRLYSMKG